MRTTRWMVAALCGDEGCADPVPFDVSDALGYNPGVSGHLPKSKEEAEEIIALYRQGIAKKTTPGTITHDLYAIEIVFDLPEVAVARKVGRALMQMGGPRPGFEEIPDYTAHIPLAEFVESVKSGGFTDYYGTGYYAYANEMSRDDVARPSDIKAGRIRHEFTHVMWFNK